MYAWTVGEVSHQGGTYAGGVHCRMLQLFGLPLTHRLTEIDPTGYEFGTGLRSSRTFDAKQTVVPRVIGVGHAKSADVADLVVNVEQLPVVLHNVFGIDHDIDSGRAQSV